MIRLGITLSNLSIRIPLQSLRASFPPGDALGRAPFCLSLTSLQRPDQFLKLLHVEVLFLHVAKQRKHVIQGRIAHILAVMQQGLSL